MQFADVDLFSSIFFFRLGIMTVYVYVFDKCRSCSCDLVNLWSFIIPLAVAIQMKLLIALLLHVSVHLNHKLLCCCASSPHNMQRKEQLHTSHIYIQTNKHLYTCSEIRGIHRQAHTHTYTIGLMSK